MAAMAPCTQPKTTRVSRHRAAVVRSALGLGSGDKIGSASPHLGPGGAADPSAGCSGQSAGAAAPTLRRTSSRETLVARRRGMRARLVTAAMQRPWAEWSEKSRTGESKHKRGEDLTAAILQWRMLGFSEAPAQANTQGKDNWSSLSSRDSPDPVWSDDEKGSSHWYQIGNNHEGPHGDAGTPPGHRDRYCLELGQELGACEYHCALPPGLGLMIPAAEVLSCAKHHGWGEVCSSTFSEEEGSDGRWVRCLLIIDQDNHLHAFLSPDSQVSLLVLPLLLMTKVDEQAEEGGEGMALGGLQTLALRMAPDFLPHTSAEASDAEEAEPQTKGTSRAAAESPCDEADAAGVAAAQGPLATSPRIAPAASRCSERASGCSLPSESLAGNLVELMEEAVQQNEWFAASASRLRDAVLASRNGSRGQQGAMEDGARKLEEATGQGTAYEALEMFDEFCLLESADGVADGAIGVDQMSARASSGHGAAPAELGKILAQERVVRFRFCNGEDRDVWEAVVLGAILEEQEAWHATNGLGGGEPREGALLPGRRRLQLASLSARWV